MKKTMSKKILSPLRRDGYKAGMIMMLIALSTMLLTTACSSEDDLVNNTANTENTINKGYALPVTINVTREGDATTRATYNESTGKLSFSAGDKLFVWSYYGGSAGAYAGVLDWVSDGTFSGTITTQNPYTGTIDALLSGGTPAAAVLLPAGYGDYGYLSTEGNVGAYYDEYDEDYTKAFVASTTEKTAKALAVEQFSFETGSYTSGTGFALEPNNAILNFTITGLTASTNVTATIKKGEDVLVSGSVTTDGSGNATFAMGIESATEINPLTLTVGGKEITITSTNTVFDAGKIYNIARSAAPAAKAAAEATAEDKGKLIGTDGNIYADVAAATAAGTTAVAKIIYLGTTGHATYSHGLALALTDEGQMAWGAAMTACNTTKNTSTPVTGATWLLASKDQWEYMVGTNGAGSYTDLRDGFSGISGASNLQSGEYWSSWAADSNFAYPYHFGNGGWSYNNKGNGYVRVRACLAF